MIGISLNIIDTDGDNQWKAVIIVGDTPDEGEMQSGIANEVSKCGYANYRVETQLADKSNRKLIDLLTSIGVTIHDEPPRKNFFIFESKGGDLYATYETEDMTIDFKKVAANAWDIVKDDMERRWERFDEILRKQGIFETGHNNITRFKI